MIPLLLLAALVVIAALQAAGFDIMSSPLVVALLAFMTLVGDSWVSSLLIKAAPKIKPQQIVWLVSAIIAAAAMFLGGTRIPLIGMLEPPAYLAVLGALATVWAEATKLLYEFLLKRWWKTADHPQPAQPALPTL